MFSFSASFIISDTIQTKFPAFKKTIFSELLILLERISGATLVGNLTIIHTVVADAIAEVKAKRIASDNGRLQFCCICSNIVDKRYCYGLSCTVLLLER
ncbi:hypothetical protein ACHWQZ_G018145 [Mnemiopsis leidyi]